MVLCDCGAETTLNYAGDLTRTFPVDKQFSTKQKEIYDIVHSAHLKAISELKPGRLFKDVHLAACKVVIGIWKKRRKIENIGMPWRQEAIGRPRKQSQNPLKKFWTAPI